MPARNVREALENISRVITEQPEKARAKHPPATARLLDGLRCEVRGPKGEVAFTDMPPAVGGEASAPTPGWLLRASLASCTATSIAMRAARLGVTLTTLEVTVESESDNRGMLGLDDRVSAGLSPIRTRVRVGAESTPADQLRALAEWGDQHSVVACTARNSPTYSLEVEVL